MKITGKTFGHSEFTHYICSMKKQIEIKKYGLSVNESGLVLNAEGKELKQFIANGYQNVKVKVNGTFKAIRVHRLVAIAFIPNPDNKKCVDHIDGNKLNNNANNLRWCTIGENLQFDNVKRNPTIYKVKCIKPNGEITEYENILDACLFQWQKYKILECCNGKRKSYNGCKWELIK